MEIEEVGIIRSSIKYYTKSLPLIGIYNEIWYPIINNFYLKISQNTRFFIYKYNNDRYYNNERDYSNALINEFKDNYQNKFKDINNFGDLAGLIIEDKIFNKIEEIIEIFPEDIK